jgi:hypothetical protein
MGISGETREIPQKLSGQTGKKHRGLLDGAVGALPPRAYLLRRLVLLLLLCRLIGKPGLQKGGGKHGWFFWG